MARVIVRHHKSPFISSLTFLRCQAYMVSNDKCYRFFGWAMTKKAPFFLTFKILFVTLQTLLRVSSIIQTTKFK